MPSVDVSLTEEEQDTLIERLDRLVSQALRRAVRVGTTQALTAAGVEGPPQIDSTTGEPHTGAMIALVPVDSERWAIGDENVGESPDSLHVTLAYLGNSDDIPGEVQAELHRALKLSTESSEWYEGQVFGASIWNATDEPSLNLAIGGASIELAHERIQDIITQVAVKCAWGMPQQHLPWVAHMCLAYDDVEHLKYFIDEAVELEGSIEFDRIRFALGGVSVDYPLMRGNNLPPVNTESLTAAATEPLPEGLPPPSTPIAPIFPASVTLDELVLIERAWRLEVKNAIIPELEAVMRKTADRVLQEVSVRAPVLWSAEQPIAHAYLTRVENQLVGVGNDMWLRTRDELIVGMQSGESIPQLSARVKDVLETTNARATMIARTEVIGASNAGALQQVRLLPPEAQPSKKTWLCVTGDTKVWSPQPLEVVKRRRGPGVLIRIQTSRDILTVTPNHPILTTRGWISARDLSTSDYLVHYISTHSLDGVNITTNVTDFGLNPDVENEPPQIDEVFRTATDGLSSRRMMSTVVDLDVKPIECEVEVVELNGDLRSRLQAPFTQPSSDELFVLTDIELETLFNLSASSSLLQSQFEGSIGRSSSNTLTRNLTTLSIIELINRQSLHIRARSKSDPSFTEMPSNDTTVNTQSSSDTQATFSTQILLDEIVDIVKIDAGWHDVYDLTTECGWYVANGIVVHNSTRDKRTRLEHRVADGQTVPLDGKFTVDGEKLDYPGDPDASAHTRVNCRCAITWHFDTLTSSANPLVMFDRYVRDSQGKFAPKSGGGGGGGASAQSSGKKKLAPGKVDTKRLNASEAAELKDIEGQYANGAISEKEYKYKTYYVKVKASKRINKSGGAGGEGPGKPKVKSKKAPDTKPSSLGGLSPSEHAAAKSPGLKTGDKVGLPGGAEGEIVSEHGNFVKVKTDKGTVLYGKQVLTKKGVGGGESKSKGPEFKTGDKITTSSGSKGKVIGTASDDSVMVELEDGSAFIIKKNKLNRPSTPSSSSGPSSVGATPKKKLTAGKVKDEHYNVDEAKQQFFLDAQLKEGVLTPEQHKKKTNYLKYKVATRHNASAPGSSGGVKTGGGGVSSAVPGLHSNVPGVASSIPASIRQPNSLTRKTALKNADMLRKSSRSQIESDYKAKPNDAVLRAHKAYTGSGYTPMNRAARGQEVASPTTARNIKKMDEAFSVYGKKNNETLFVNRGVKGRYASDLGKLKPGETITEHGFMSTSTSKMTGNSFGSSGRRIEIAIPAGKTTIAGTDYENELIFPRNTQLKFIGKSEDGILQFDMI